MAAVGKRKERVRGKERERETQGWRSKVLRYSRCRHEEADFAAVAVSSFEEFARRLRRCLHKLPKGMAGGSGVGEILDEEEAISGRGEGREI